MSKRTLLFLCLLFFCCAALGKSEEQSAGLMVYLPDSSQVDGWSLAFAPEEAEGDDLFLLIDGGAELYHEYGFKRALVAEYSGPGSRKINIEMYRMRDPFSAYGIFSFKAGAKGEKLNIEDGAVLEDYYLTFYKSDIQISVTALDSSKETRKDLIRFAEAISLKIGKSDGNLPDIVSLLPAEGNEFHYIKYIKGYLGLMNNFDFGLGNLFGVSEGVIGKWGNTTGILLKYPASSDAGKWFGSSGERFKTSDRYREFSLNDGRYSVVDEKERQIVVVIKSTCLMILIGNDKKDIEMIRYQIENRIEGQGRCTDEEEKK